uniref:Peptidase S1 domain-containing protein n=1 Tax=Labrus bergylta TaxID=56723 RepID=A0A3Q3GDI0_9LABR
PENQIPSNHIMVGYSSTLPNVWTLYFGRETQGGPNVNEVNRSVSQVIVNPNYNDTLFNNDIALMKLTSPVNFTDYIRPICLASNSSQFHNSTLCWATGWGRRGGLTGPCRQHASGRGHHQGGSQAQQWGRCHAAEYKTSKN